MTPTKYVNPLDNLFDIDPAGREDHNTLAPVTAGELAEMATPTAAPEKDAEDIEVDKKIDQVYDAALETFQNQMAYTEIIEPRYAARNAEVAASYLNIALQAAATRARVKGDRKRNGAFIPGMGNKITNNTIVATRDEIMRMINVDGNNTEV